MVFPLKFIQNLHDQSSLCSINLPTDKCCKQALVRRYRGMGKIGKNLQDAVTQQRGRTKGSLMLCSSTNSFYSEDG